MAAAIEGRGLTSIRVRMQHPQGDSSCCVMQPPSCHAPVQCLWYFQSTRLPKGFTTGSLPWKGVHGARMYQVYICDGDPTTTGTWSIVGMTSKARFTAKDLENAKKYTFRATASGVIGEGPVSEAVTVATKAA